MFKKNNEVGILQMENQLIVLFSSEFDHREDYLSKVKNIRYQLKDHGYKKVDI